MPYILYIIIYLIVFYMGMTIFSYLNLVVERLPKKENILIRYTSCPDCGHEQGMRDVIPIFSRIRYQNRCQYCGTKLRTKPLVIECIGGVCAVLSLVFYGIHIAAFWYFLVICDLFLITMIDAQTQEIPVQFNIALLILGIPAIFLFPEIPIVERLIGLVAISVPMFILMLFNGFGGGDVKMMFAAGLMLGWKGNVAAFFIGVITGGVYAIVMLATKKKGRKDHFAFGPFLAAGILIALTRGLGDYLVGMYVDYVKSMLHTTDESSSVMQIGIQLCQFVNTYIF